MSKTGGMISWKNNNFRASREYLVPNNDDSSTASSLPYARTSTPLPTRKNPAKITNYSINMGYEKWVDKLNHPPTKLRVKGVKYPPEDIISGHLMSIPISKSPPPRIVLENLYGYERICTPSLPEETNKDKVLHSKHSISEKIRSIFKISGKSFIRKTCEWLKSSDEDLCINGYPKCKCKLGRSIVGNYNLPRIVYK